jgi:hypothetical protein
MIQDLAGKSQTAEQMGTLQDSGDEYGIHFYPLQARQISGREEYPMQTKKVIFIALRI